MKLKLLKVHEDQAVGDVLEFEEKDLEIAKGLIAAGIAEEFEEEDLVSIVKGIVDEAVKHAQAKQVKEFAKNSKLDLPGAVEVHENWKDDPKKGFKTFGIYAKDLHTATVRGTYSKHFEEYIKAFGDGQNEGVAADGGVLVPAGFSPNIIEAPMVNSGLDLAPLTNVIPISGDLMKFPVLKNTDQSGTARHGGVIASWMKEGADLTDTKAQFKTDQLVLNKLGALVFVTSELLADSAIALESYLSSKSGMAIVDVKNESIIRGDGVEECLGYITAPGTVSITRETGGTVTIGDIVNIVARSTNRSNSVWVINQELYPVITQMSVDNVRMLVPGGLDSTEFDTLLGRPVIWTDLASAKGTVGDIAFCDFGSYITIVKNNSQVQVDTSIHLKFLSDQVAFRFITRMDGQPALSSAVTPKNGTDLLSPFVMIAT